MKKYGVWVIILLLSSCVQKGFKPTLQWDKEKTGIYVFNLEPLLSEFDAYVFTNSDAIASYTNAATQYMKSPIKRLATEKQAKLKQAKDRADCLVHAGRYGFFTISPESSPFLVGVHTSYPLVHTSDHVVEYFPVTNRLEAGKEYVLIVYKKDLYPESLVRFVLTNEFPSAETLSHLRPLKKGKK